MTKGRQLVTRLIEAASEAGCAVPDQITDAVATIERLEAAWHQLPPVPPSDSAALILEDEIYETAWAGKELPDIAKRYAKLKVDAEAAQIGAQVLRGVVERSDERLVSVFHGQIHAILLDHEADAGRAARGRRSARAEARRCADGARRGREGAEDPLRVAGAARHGPAIRGAPKRLQPAVGRGAPPAHRPSPSTRPTGSRSSRAGRPRPTPR